MWMLMCFCWWVTVDRVEVKVEGIVEGVEKRRWGWDWRDVNFDVYVNVLILMCLYADVFMCWSVGVLVCWYVDVKMCWGVDVMMCWCWCVSVGLFMLMCWCWCWFGCSCWCGCSMLHVTCYMWMLMLMCTCWCCCCCWCWCWFVCFCWCGSNMVCNMLDVDVDVDDRGFCFWLNGFHRHQISAKFSIFVHVWAWQQKTTPILAVPAKFRKNSERQCNQAKQFEVGNKIYEDAKNFGKTVVTFPKRSPVRFRRRFWAHTGFGFWVGFRKLPIKMPGNEPELSLLVCKQEMLLLVVPFSAELNIKVGDSCFVLQLESQYQAIVEQM